MLISLDTPSTPPQDSRMSLSSITSLSLMSPRSKGWSIDYVKSLTRLALVSSRTESLCHGTNLPPPTRGKLLFDCTNGDPSSSSRFVFLTYPDAPQAENALRALHNLSFGKAHTLFVNRFGDIEKYANMPIGEGELPSGWREKQYVERVSLDVT